MPKGRILAVDDQRYFRELIEGLLQEEGYEVRTASSGDEALQILEHAGFDVVITDLVMPVMNGSDLVQRIKERNPDQDVVVVTGVVDVKSAVDAMKIGANDYLLKPFDRQTLATSLESIMARRRLLSERDRLLAENIEYLGERSLFESALSLFTSLSSDVLSERLLEGLSSETGAQGAVLWLAVGDGRGPLQLRAAHGLVRAEEERRSLELADLPTDLVAGAGTALVDAGDPDDSRTSLTVALRRGEQLLGIARLSDKLGGDDFDDTDRACAEKYAQFAQGALENARRFESLERHSLQDPVSGAYRLEYLEDLARNEIERANRFGRTFGLLKIEVSPADALRRALGETAFRGWWSGLTVALRRTLRATDLLAADDDFGLWLLLTESDSIGTATFKRRTRMALESCDVLGALPQELGPELRIGVVTYPGDASQFESLRRVLAARVEADAGSIALARRLDALSVSECLHLLLEEAVVEPVETVDSLVRLALGEVGRRARDRNLFFFHPGRAFASGLEAFDTGRAAADGTEVVIMAEPPAPREGEGPVTWLPAARLGGCPPFLVHFGDGPPYVLVSDDESSDQGRALHHTNDPGVAEYLAFRLQRELRLPALG
jgi:CheY-like chemotaxis protein/GGDEF domain-containing protein